MPPIAEIPPKPDEATVPINKKFGIFSVLIAAFLGLATLILTYFALSVAVDFIATFYCSGWNEESMHVQSCSIPGIEKYADDGNAILLFAAFSGGLLLAIPSVVAIVFAIYWITRIRGWKSDNLPSRLFAWSGMVASVLSLVIFASPIVVAIGYTTITYPQTQKELKEVNAQLSTPVVIARYECPNGHALEIYDAGMDKNENFHPWPLYELSESTTTLGYVHNGATILSNQLSDEIKNELATCTFTRGTSVEEVAGVNTFLGDFKNIQYASITAPLEFSDF